MVRSITGSSGSVHIARGRQQVWKQVHVTLRPKSRGCHLVTNELRASLDENLKDMEMGLAHLWMMHTSASLTVNENCDPSVRTDMESAMNRIVGSGHKFFTHMDEGDDDMPAHVKSSLMGAGLTIPIAKVQIRMYACVAWTRSKEEMCCLRD